MAFKEVPGSVDFPVQERAVLRFWKETDAFNKMRAIHRDEPKWSFIDGPITANNPMGLHHGWGRSYKDLYNRFWTMRGRRLRYQQGFDCQGLWVEVEVEKERGFTSKKDIEDYGLDRFVRECKARVLRYSAVQTEQSIRLGYWMDWNDTDLLRDLADRLTADPMQQVTVQGPTGPVTDTVEQIVGRLGLPELGGSYYTFSNENNYMIWTFLKRCWERGWLYKGADSMPWCPRCATGISQHEIVTDGYAELTHKAVTLRFPLRSKNGQPVESRESLLVWTTTPWTLTSNVVAAVGPALDYVKVRQGDEVFYLSKGTTHMLRGKYEVLDEFKGAAMAGWTYTGPFDELPAANQPGGFTVLRDLIAGVEQSAVQAHHVILWDDVSEAEGTGIVHIAPGCGAEDFEIGKAHGFPIIVPIDEEGVFVDGFDWLSGMGASAAAGPIFDSLKVKGLLYDVHDYTHRYPVCWRCKTELVFRLVDEWFISMGEVYDKPREALTAEEKARSLRYQIMDVVDQIRWIPEFGHARELDWLRNMHDWMISKKRYWGLALPIWVCGACDHFEVIGSHEELEARAVEGWDVFEGHTPHRPFVDAVKIACSKCGGAMSRIPDVGNPWLDAGIVSFSTLQYRTNPDYWRKWFPADWISESFPGQFRNWFYSLLAMSTVLENQPPFKTVFSYATLLGPDGRPMHKSWGNMIEFNEAADQIGVDVMRWLYFVHRPENDLLFSYERADEVRRQFLLPLWNVYSFFVTYANIDGWTPGDAAESDNPLDRWVIARLNEVIRDVTPALEGYDSFAATRVVEAFLDDLTNWYVRRSRQRFWKSEHDSDKHAAYTTLYRVLTTLVKLLAPMTPFVAEVMYQNLVRSVDASAPESVHHCYWPDVDEAAIDAELLASMGLAVRVASVGRAARAAADAKLRQPLAQALVHLDRSGRAAWRDALTEVVVDELNVKALAFVDDESALLSYRLLPDNKKLGPKFGPQFPKVRAALSEVEAALVAPKLRAGQPLPLEVDGEIVELAADEVLIETDPREGLAVASEPGVTVAVDTRLTPELRAEGLAREVVRRIQTTRKDADFRIEDYITTYYQADGELAEVIPAWADYIQRETLTEALVAGPAPDGAFVAEHRVEGHPLVVGVVRK
ncbi:MAG: class I tRNA ligase family protein [Anaerolineae bacterium]|nr:class I tRNA ligase family protein [Anaerolineae bacterium]